MMKLVNEFMAAPTVTNAVRLLAYVEKHPMTVCVFGDAVALAEKIVRR